MAWHGFGPRENKSGFITITTALPSYHAALAGWMHGWMDAGRECCRQVHRWADGRCMSCCCFWQLRQIRVARVVVGGGAALFLK